MECTGRSLSCSKVEFGKKYPTVHHPTSLSLSSINNWTISNPDPVLYEESASKQRRESNDSLKLVQNCGPDCMITQKIVDRLLARMLDLENERSELLAANRSWAVQFNMMQNQQESQIKQLEEELKTVKLDSKLKANAEAVNPREDSSSPWRETQDKLNLLSHQAEVYREDFLEERKARVRAHAQIETLRNELKRERKSRAKLSSMINQTKSFEEVTSVLSA